MLPSQRPPGQANPLARPWGTPWAHARFHSFMAALALALSLPVAHAAGTPDERAAAYQQFRTAFDSGD